MPTPSKHIHREWTPDEDALLRSLYADGLSAAQASLQLPGRSRNSVLGRLDRLGLNGQGIPRGERRLTQSRAARANFVRKKTEERDIMRAARKAGVSVVTRVGRREGVDDEWARAEILANERDPYEPPPFKGYDPARDPKPDWLRFSFQNPKQEAA